MLKFTALCANSTFNYKVKRFAIKIFFSKDYSTTLGTMQAHLIILVLHWKLLQSQFHMHTIYPCAYEKLDTAFLKNI